MDRSHAVKWMISLQSVLATESQENWARLSSLVTMCLSYRMDTLPRLLNVLAKSPLGDVRITDTQTAR